MSKSKKIKPETTVCLLCGGTNVETKAWIDVNTNEVLDFCSDGDSEDNWCRDCEEHVELISYKEYQNQK